ncbi:MAG: hypothetical protein AAGG01_07385 [Planctomycetota bacterium]
MTQLAPLAAFAFAIATSAPAVSQATSLPFPPEQIPGSIRSAGVYHLATGTWTRTGSSDAAFGPEVIYSNTAVSGYFSSAGGAGGFAPGSINYDEGNVPGAANANNPGNRDFYSVNCLQIGYCDLGAPGSAGWELSFYSSYAPCQGSATPDAVISTSGLPANGCWTVDIDLTGGHEFCLAADGGDGFDDVVNEDTFGWSYRFTGSDGSQPAGFLLAGNPRATDSNYVIGGSPPDGTNTYFGPPSLCSPTSATGLLTQDLWFLEDLNVPINSGCYFFSPGYINGTCTGPFMPFVSWFMEIQADASACSDDLSTTYCFSNPNTTGVNSTMTVTGSLSIAEDDVTLTATLPPTHSGSSSPRRPRTSWPTRPTPRATCVSVERLDASSSSSPTRAPRARSRSRRLPACGASARSLSRPP